MSAVHGMIFDDLFGLALRLCECLTSNMSTYVRSGNEDRYIFSQIEPSSYQNKYKMSVNFDTTHCTLNLGRKCRILVEFTNSPTIEHLIEIASSYGALTKFTFYL